MWGLCSSLCSTWSKNSLAGRGCIRFDVLEMKGKRYDCANYAGSLYVLAVCALRARAVARGGEQRPSMVLQGKAPCSPVLFIFVFKIFGGCWGRVLCLKVVLVDPNVYSPQKRGSLTGPIAPTGCPCRTCYFCKSSLPSAGPPLHSHLAFPLNRDSEAE